MLEPVTTWLRIHADRRAVTAIEYGLIAGLVALAIITGVALIGSDLGTTFTSVSSAI